jgi:L-lactate utilization protein LutB
VLPADAKTVFDTNPGGMWKSLHGAPGMKRAAYVQDQPLLACHDVCPKDLPLATQIAFMRRKMVKMAWEK